MVQHLISRLNVRLQPTLAVRQRAIIKPATYLFIEGFVRSSLEKHDCLLQVISLRFHSHPTRFYVLKLGRQLNDMFSPIQPCMIGRQTLSRTAHSSFNASSMASLLAERSSSSLRSLSPPIVPPPRPGDPAPEASLTGVEDSKDGLETCGGCRSARLGLGGLECGTEGEIPEDETPRDILTRRSTRSER